MGEKSESCFSCSSIYTALSATESAHIYTCRCELISFLHTQVFQDLQAKEWQVGSHSLCVCENSKNDNPELKTEMCMPLTSITTPNPWTMLTTDNIAQCDQPFFNKYGGVASYQNMINSQKSHPNLVFSCLPDPFCGDPDSKVYCLNKNPGKPDKCFIGDTKFEEATKYNLALKQKSCFWAEGINNTGKVHDGVEWLTKRTRVLKGILGRHPNIFFVEYFPYHSSSGFDFPCDLPSYTFTNELVLQAMKDGKMVIIMREKRNWLKRIPGLENYKNLYTLKYAQSGYLTLNNVVKMDTGQNLTEDKVKQYF